MGRNRVELDRRNVCHLIIVQWCLGIVLLTCNCLLDFVAR